MNNGSNTFITLHEILLGLDPYFMAYEMIPEYNRAVLHPLYTTHKHGFGHCSGIQHYLPNLLKTVPSILTLGGFFWNNCMIRVMKYSLPGFDMIFVVWLHVNPNCMK